MNIEGRIIGNRYEIIEKVGMNFGIEIKVRNIFLN